MPKIKYGLEWFAVLGSFNEAGEYKFDDGEEDPGMTCATFVSELLAGQGLTLVDYSKWLRDEVPEEDLNWRAAKIEDFRSRGKYTSERIAIMETIDPFIRLRPEEVAAVAAEDLDQWDKLEHHRKADVAQQDEAPQPTIEELAKDVVKAFADAFK